MQSKEGKFGLKKFVLLSTIYNAKTIKMEKNEK